MDRCCSHGRQAAFKKRSVVPVKGCIKSLHVGTCIHVHVIMPVWSQTNQLTYQAVGTCQKEVQRLRFLLKASHIEDVLPSVSGEERVSDLGTATSFDCPFIKHSDQTDMRPLYHTMVLSRSAASYQRFEIPAFPCFEWPRCPSVFVSIILPQVLLRSQNSGENATDSRWRSPCRESIIAERDYQLGKMATRAPYSYEDHDEAQSAEGHLEEKALISIVDFWVSCKNI